MIDIDTLATYISLAITYWLHIITFSAEVADIFHYLDCEIQYIGFHIGHTE